MCERLLLSANFTTGTIKPSSIATATPIWMWWLYLILSPNQDVFTFGRPHIAIDILTKLKGIEFSDSFEKSEIHTINDIPVRVINLNQLKAAKKAAGRYKDLDDLKNLE
jgi:hypothetical protein